MALLPWGGRASSSEPADKLGAFLRYQLSLKREFAAAPDGVLGEALAMAGGGRWNPLRQQLFVYCAAPPDLLLLERMQILGVRAYPETWIPPVGVHRTGFFLADAPIEQVEALAGAGEVLKLESAERAATPQNDEAAKVSKVLAVRALGYTGSGVRVAILDSGLDRGHDDLPEPLVARDFSNFPTLDDDVHNPVSGHGTHVAGTMLGRGVLSSGKYTGMAPGAGLIFLKVGSDQDASASFASMIMALKAAVDEYDADIVTIAYGAWDAYHDGTSVVAQTVDWANQQGALVFAAAGNEAQSGLHDSTLLAPEGWGEVALHVSEPIPLRLDAVWNDGKGRTDPLSFTLFDTARQTPVPLEVVRGAESARGTESAVIAAPALQSGIYILKATCGASSPVARRVHFYLGEAAGDRVFFLDPDPAYTLDTPADAEGAIAVAAYVSRTTWINYQGYAYTFDPSPGEVLEVAAYSSHGPTVDGRMKPDIAAPGTAVISLRDSVYAPGGDYDPFIIANRSTAAGIQADYYVMGGTSSACPVAAGAAALLLEAYPALKGQPEIIRNALLDGIMQAPYPWFVAGAGFLNVENAWRLLAPYQTRTHTPTPTFTATPTASATAKPSHTPSRTPPSPGPPSPTPTCTPSETPTVTWTPTPTGSPTPESTATATASCSATPTATATASCSTTPTPTAEGTATPTATVGTATPTLTSLPTATETPTPTATPILPRRMFLPYIARTMFHPRPTPQPSATPEPTATPGGPRPFFDDFSDPASGWATADSLAYSLGYTEGEYAITVKANLWKVPSYAPVSAAPDAMRLSVRARQISGGAAAYGVLFGGSGVHALLVSPLGYVALWRYDGDERQWKEVRSWQAMSAVRSGALWNEIAVEKRGDVTEVRVNGALVRFTPKWEGDAQWASRALGLIAASYSTDPVECRFDDFSVEYTLPSGLP